MAAEGPLEGAAAAEAIAKAAAMLLLSEESAENGVAHEDEDEADEKDADGVDVDEEANELRGEAPGEEDGEDLLEGAAAPTVGRGAEKAGAVALPRDAAADDGAAVGSTSTRRMDQEVRPCCRALGAGVKWSSCESTGSGMTEELEPEVHTMSNGA